MSKAKTHLIAGQTCDHDEFPTFCHRLVYEKGSYKSAETTCKTCLRNFEAYKRWVKEHGSRI